MVCRSQHQSIGLEDTMNKGKRQIGMLGGSFDPVHMGHIGLAQETREKFSLDQILFIPVFQSPHKSHIPLTSTTHRMEMLRLALRDSAHFGISDTEMRREEISYTIDTLNHFRFIYPNSELFLIMGYDNLLDLDSWKGSREIMKKCHILVASRPGSKPFSSTDKIFGLFNGDSPYRLGKIKNKNQEFIHRETENKLVVYDISPRDISSSVVRERLASGKSVDNLLPPEVETYIIGHRIYKT